MSSPLRQQLAQLRELLRAADPDVIRQGLMLFSAFDDPELADALLRDVRVELVPSLPTPGRPHAFGRQGYQRLVPNAAFRGPRAKEPRLERLLLSTLALAPEESKIATRLRGELRRVRLRMPEHEDGFELADLAGLRLESLLLFRPRSLAGLEELHGLRELEIDTSAAELDLAPAGGAEGLEVLRVVASARMRVVGSVGTRIVNPEALRALPLRELRLRHLVGLEELGFLRGMPLETLELLNAPAATLGPLASLTRLRALHLARVAGSELAILGELPALEELHLAHLGLPPEGLGRLPRLRRLHLRQLSDRAIQLHALPRLERLVVGDCAVLEELALGPELRLLWRVHTDRCPRLETISGGAALPALLDVQTQRTPRLLAVARPDPEPGSLVGHPDPGLRSTLVTRLPVESSDLEPMRALARDASSETSGAALARLLDAELEPEVMAVLHDPEAPASARGRAATLLVPRRADLPPRLDALLADATLPPEVAGRLLAARAATAATKPPAVAATLDDLGARWRRAAELAAHASLSLERHSGVHRSLAMSTNPPGRRLQLRRLADAATGTLDDVDHLVLDELELAPGETFPALPALQTLELRATNLADLRPLSALPQIRSLHVLRGRSLRALDGAEALSELSTLRLQRTRVRELAPIEGLRLRRLVLPEARVRSLAPLKARRELLEHLDLQATLVRSLEPLRGALRLQTLVVDQTPITRTAPLTSFPSLRELSLRACAELDGFEALGALTTLIRLDLADTAFDDAPLLFGLPELQILRVTGSPAAKDPLALETLGALLSRRGGALRRSAPIG